MRRLEPGEKKRAYRTEYYLSRIFGREITGKAFFRVFTMNPVTEKQLHSKLREISELEGMKVDSAVIEGIVQSSNRDVRNAMLTLGMYLITQKGAKDSGKRKKIIKEDIGPDRAAYAKDSSIGIFHGVAKFLYNKRMLIFVRKLQKRY